MAGDVDDLRPVLEGMPESVAVYDRDARVVYANPATERTFGRTLAEMQGRRLWDLFPEAVGNLFHQAFERVAAGGDAETFDHYYAPFDRWFRNRVERFGDRVHVVARDVTDDVRRQRRLEAIARISGVLTAEVHELAPALQAVAQALSEVLDADCSLALLSPDRMWLQVAAMASSDPASLKITGAVARWPAQDGHPGEALRGRTVVLADAAALEREGDRAADPKMRDVLARYRPTSLVVAPLLVGDEAIGVLIASRRDDARPLTPDDRTLAAHIAPTVGLYVAHARRRAEATSLRRRLEAVSDSNPALVAFVDRDLRYQYVNASYERWFDIPRDEILGRRLGDVLDADAYRTVEPHALRALAGDRVRFRTSARYPGGERQVDVQYEPIRDANGDVEGFAVTVLDITAETRLAEHERERLQAERRATRRLESLLAVTSQLARSDTADEISRVVVDEGVAALEATMAALWLLDGDGRDLVLQRQRGLLPEHVAAFSRVPVDVPGPLRDCITGGQAVWVESRADYAARYPELERTHRPGSAPPLVFAILPLVSQGQVTGCINFTFHDERRLTPDDRTFLEVLASHVSEALRRARLYADLRGLYEDARGARAEAEAANSAKDQFLAMLGHELRNPLAPITTALELMRLRAPGQVERERAVIERQVQHLSRLVDDLLDVSRITRGKIELRRERASMAAIVAKAIEVASPLLEQRRQQLTVDVAPHLAVNGDPVRLGQVVANVLSNAAKYTDSGGHVDVRAAQSGEDVVLTVRDDGIGIAPEMVPRVFDLFVQAPQTLARTDGGLGLGLAIVRSLVELHGGRVAAHSEGLGKGSTFVVTLPAAASEVTPAEAAPAPRATPATAVRRVLVVDDNEDAATLVAEALAAHGHVVRTAFDGPSALRIAAELRPEVAVLDLGLPVMDGYELAQRLRAGPPGRLRLIAVTGYGQDADRARSRVAGFDAHLTKPVSIEALVELVGAAG